MNVNLDYYKIFYYVAKYENFTRAAQALGNSQPNVTRAMNCLEQQINSTLFVRTNRGVQLTQEGKRLYEHVSIVMAQLLEAEEELADNEGIFQGSISIGASETALNIFLLDILKSFHKMYPKVRLKIYNHSTPQAIEAVKSGKIDFAVVSTPVKVKSPLEKTILCSFKEILIGGTDFEHIKDDSISLKNLKDYPLISLGQETTTYDFYNKIFLKHGIELNPDTEVATTDQIIPLVKSDLGMAFVPEPMARESIEKNEIVEISLKEKIPNREICIVHDCQHPLNSAARKLKNEICSC